MRFTGQSVRVRRGAEMFAPRAEAMSERDTMHAANIVHRWQRCRCDVSAKRYVGTYVYVTANATRRVRETESDATRPTRSARVQVRTSSRTYVVATVHFSAAAQTYARARVHTSLLYIIFEVGARKEKKREERTLFGTPDFGFLTRNTPVPL